MPTGCRGQPVSPWETVRRVVCLTRTIRGDPFPWFMEHTQHLRALHEHKTACRVATWWGQGDRVDHLVPNYGSRLTLCGRTLRGPTWDTISFTPGPVWNGRGRCKRCAALYANSMGVDA